MASNVPKPENTLKRAEELIAVGQQPEALNVLHATISHRRLKVHGWDPSTELIMMRFVRLCVDLEKLKMVREGLHYYRYLTHQHNVLSLAKVMRELRDLSEAKLDDVKQRADAAALARGVDDLEADESPESLMLSTLQVDVRNESAKQLHAALLGCWESYKIIMDLLRFAPKLDYLYHDTAQRALTFCRNNNRHQEFRRLCETLRLQYTNFQRHRNKPEYEGLLRPENHLTTRLVQMSVAADLNLWTQCFQTAEDILSLGLHDLLQRSLTAKDPASQKLQVMLLSHTSTFYDKLASMFFVSGQKLFHASAILRNLFHTKQHKRNVSPADQMRLCDLSTIAVLCVPVLAKAEQTANDLEYLKRLASMLAHGGVPTRASMHAVIEGRGVVASTSPCVQQLYSIIGGDINPMTICSEVHHLLEDIAAIPYLVTYVPHIKQVVFDQLLLKLSEIYTSVSIEFFTSYVCPVAFLPWSDAEALIVQLIDRGCLQLRLDYSKKLLVFGESTTAKSDTVLKNRLVHVAQLLADLVQKLNVPKKSTPTSQANNHLRFYEDFQMKLQAEQARLSLRNRALADRRQRQEEEMHAKEEQRKTEEKARQRKEEQEEQVRREQALKHQEAIRRQEEIQQLKMELAKQIVAEFKSLSDKAVGKITVKGKSIDEIQPEEIISYEYTYEDYEKSQEELRNRERQEKNRQQRLELKRIEHLVRAIREEESLALPQWQDLMRSKDNAVLVDFLKDEEERWKAGFMNKVARHQCFLSIKDIQQKWTGSHLAERQKEYNEKVKDRLEGLTKALKKEKIERARNRRFEVIERSRIEAEERQRLEEERRQREAQEMRDRAAEKQRQKDAEIEQRQHEARAAPTIRAEQKPTQKEIEWRKPQTLKTPISETKPAESTSSKPPPYVPRAPVRSTQERNVEISRGLDPRRGEDIIRREPPVRASESRPERRRDAEVDFSRADMAPPVTSRLPVVTQTVSPPVVTTDTDGFTTVAKKARAGRTGK